MPAGRSRDQGGGPGNSSAGYQAHHGHWYVSTEPFRPARIQGM